MSVVISQNMNAVKHGSVSIVTTVVRLSAASATINLPNMLASSNSVVQLRRPGDAAVTVTQSDINTVAISGGAKGNEVMLVSVSSDPVTEATEHANS